MGNLRYLVCSAVVSALTFSGVITANKYFVDSPKDFYEGQENAMRLFNDPSYQTLSNTNKTPLDGDLFEELRNFLDKKERERRDKVLKSNSFSI